jgi:nucleoside-diphosphate-sugar epimerase
MRVVVTGASGFIGRYVLAELERLEIPTSLLLRGPASASAAWGQHRVIVCDLHEPAEAIFESSGRPDVLIHLAWGGLPNYRSTHHLDKELPAQERFLTAMVNSGLKKVLATGTCFEYGMRSGVLSEDMLPAPANSYGIAKNELRCRLAALQDKTPFALTWARLFYLWGEGQAENSLWPLLRRAVANGDRSFPMSGGEQSRDYMRVAEAARILVSLAVCETGHGVVNVSSGRPVTVRELVEGWINHHGWSIKPDLGRLPYPDYEPMEFWGDATKLNQCMERA